MSVFSILPRITEEKDNVFVIKKLTSLKAQVCATALNCSKSIKMPYIR